MIFTTFSRWQSKGSRSRGKDFYIRPRSPTWWGVYSTLYQSQVYLCLLLRQSVFVGVDLVHYIYGRQMFTVLNLCWVIRRTYFDISFCCLSYWIPPNIWDKAEMAYINLFAIFLHVIYTVFNLQAIYFLQYSQKYPLPINKTLWIYVYHMHFTYAN